MWNTQADRSHVTRRLNCEGANPFPEIFIFDAPQNHADERLRDLFGLTRAAEYLSSWDIRPIAGKYDARFVGALPKIVGGSSDKVYVMMAFERYDSGPSLHASINVWLPMAAFEHVWRLCESTLPSSDTVLRFVCDVYAQEEAWEALRGQPRGRVSGDGSFSVIAASKPQPPSEPVAK